MVAEPSPTPPAPPPAPAAPEPAAGEEFGKTGLAAGFRFEGREWRAREVTEADPETLERHGEGPEGQELLVPRTAALPPSELLVPLPDEAGAYVRYTP